MNHLIKPVPLAKVDHRIYAHRQKNAASDWIQVEFI